MDPNIMYPVVVPPTGSEPVHSNLAMEQDGSDNDNLQATQSQGNASQATVVDDHLWGFLQPCNAALRRIDLLKVDPICKIGRNRDDNTIVLPGFKVSNKHCNILWDGNETTKSVITVQDFSSNGTFINKHKIGKGQSGILRDGNEIAFGGSTPQTEGGGAEDYRFVFRLAAAGSRDGIYAHYDLAHEIGNGSFASVYKAMHRQSGQWYAIKMIPAHKVKKNPPNENSVGNNNGNVSAFAREITILEKLSHPNICRLKETFFHDGNLSLVLELVEGGDLLEYILQRKGIAEPAAKHITYQMCDALAYIHNMGIAHRDLKPENVLLTKDDPPVVKVADFGLAKVVDSLTALRTMCGTPNYLAPEVVTQTGQEGYSHLVDSWSVGVIVFSMLTNASPFVEDEQQPDIRTRVAERHVDWTVLQRANISRHGESFIRRLLEPCPEYRMALAAARGHDWLRGYGPIQQRALMQEPSIDSEARDDQSIVSYGEPDDVESYTGEQMSQDFQQMQLEQNGSPRRERSRVLSRRSEVLSQAADNEMGGRIPEPSWQMISNSQAMEDAAAQNGAGPSTRGHKRKDHSISHMAPMPEAEEWTGVAGPAIDGGVGPRKKGRAAADSDSPRGGARSVRGTRAKAGNVPDDDAGQAVRRSTRQTPQKPTSRRN